VIAARLSSQQVYLAITAPEVELDVRQEEGVKAHVPDQRAVQRLRGMGGGA
jgi:hypothetical protein